MRTIKSIFATALLLAITLQVSAQRKYNISESSFEIAGTSNIHDWTMKSTAANGTANLRIVDSKLAGINSLNIILVAESLKSGKSSMDHVAYETLDTKTNNTISYFLKNAEKVNETTWALTGIYTIAGVSREYKTQVKIAINNDMFTLQGANHIAFTDFEMAPPTAALGAVKAGKDVTVIFNISFDPVGAKNFLSSN